jgi:hypothetical protein
MERKEIIHQYSNYLKYFNKTKLNDIKHIFYRKEGLRQHPFLSSGTTLCNICGDISYTHIIITLDEFFENNNIKPKDLNNKGIRTKLRSSIIHSENNDIDYHEIIKTTDSDLTIRKQLLTSKLYKKSPRKISTYKSKIFQTNTSRPDNIKVHLKKNEYCDICFSDIKDKFILSCNHFYCKSCLIDYVKNSMTNITQFKNLKCPKVICEEKIKEKQIERLFTGEDLQNYNKVKEKLEGLSNPLNLPCPIVDCHSYGIKSTVKRNMILCQTAKHKFCLKCLNPFHNSKCKDEALSIIKHYKMIKRCPNCKCLVEKIDDLCNNVSCVNIYCNFTFCWICMRMYDKNHYINPLSPCFGLAAGTNNYILYTNKYVRTFKCVLIFLLLIVLLPIIAIFFSFIVFTFYILAFVLDGSHVKNVKFSSDRRHRLFRFIVSGYYITMSFPMFSLGYIALGLILVISPFVYLFRKCCKKKEDDD